MAPKRVLVIEDDAGARDALGSLLAEEGYLVCTAATGRQGVEQAARFAPEIVVCDVCLPDIGGLQILRTLRTMRGDVFFVILTASCGDREVERALRQEADLFLDKPIDLSRFRSVLQQARPRAREPLHPVNAVH